MATSNDIKNGLCIEFNDNLFFDNLSVSKSKLFIVNDTIQHKVDIDNLNILQIQKNTNGINFDISTFEGNIDNYSIDQFNGSFKLTTLYPPFLRFFT